MIGGNFLIRNVQFVTICNFSLNSEYPKEVLLISSYYPRLTFLGFSRIKFSQFLFPFCSFSRRFAIVYLTFITYIYTLLQKNYVFFNYRTNRSFFQEIISYSIYPWYALSTFQIPAKQVQYFWRDWITNIYTPKLYYIYKHLQNFILAPLKPRQINFPEFF